MIAVKLTVQQHIDALKGLTEKEKVQVKEALAKEVQGTASMEQELTGKYRNAAKDAALFEKGQLKTYSLSELLDGL